MAAAGARPVHPRDLVKPAWRGWLHAVACPVSVAVGIVMIVCAHAGRARLAASVYVTTIALLFGISGLYHRRGWGARGKAVMSRLDHSMIFVFIAGTYTPFAVLLVRGTAGTVVLAVVWGGAALGVAARNLWPAAPRFAVIPLYIGLGWVAVFVLPDILHAGGVAPFVLLVVGGVLYSGGAVVYAARRPDPAPRVFGYHEVFHACVVLAAACHFLAVFLALYAPAPALS